MDDEQDLEVEATVEEQPPVIIKVGGRRYRLLGGHNPSEYLVYFVDELLTTGYVRCKWDSPTRLDFTLEKNVVAILAKPVE